METSGSDVRKVPLPLVAMSRRSGGRAGRTSLSLAVLQENGSISAFRPATLGA